MVKINPHTKLLGLIGDPVSHSLSPKLHNYVIKKLGLNYRYLAFSVNSGDLSSATSGARALGVKGLNVTVPHKVSVVREVDELTEAGEATSAVNTLIFKENDLLIGDNTDWLGFIDALRVNDFDPAGKHCLVFGAGGAARAVVYGLARAGSKQIFVVNRTVANAEELVEELQAYSGSTELGYMGLEDFSFGKEMLDYELVVNATSVGLEDNHRSLWREKPVLNPDQLVFDLIYNPFPTQFLKVASQAGAKVVGGMEMLILQGLRSLQLWTGAELDREEILAELKKYLGGKNGSQGPHCW